MDQQRKGTGQEMPQGGKGVLAAQPSPLTRLRNYFLTGIIVTAPVAITFYLAWQFIDWIDGQVTPLIPERYNPESYLPFSIPGLGLLVVFVVLTLIGFTTANIFGRTVIGLGERLLSRMPIVRSVYGALKQILETVLQQSSKSFRQVVLVEYPRRGIWALAFLTSDAQGEVQRRTEDHLVNVFLPTTPNPTSGFLLLVPRQDIVFLDMTVEEAAKMIISAGVIMPPDRLPANVTGPVMGVAADPREQEEAAPSRAAGGGAHPERK